MKKILVAMDGSDASKKALEVAMNIAKKANSSVTVISVIPGIITYNSYIYERIPDRRDIEEVMKINNENSKSMLEEAIGPYKEYEGELKTATIVGNSAEEIIREAEEGKYDLIVMGSRGLGAFSRTLLGSVSDKVVHHSKVSVLIVK